MSQTRKKELILSGLLSAIIIAIGLRRFFQGDYENTFTCILSLCLLGLPRMISKRIGVIMSPFLDGAIMLFIFAAEILGEVGAFYQKVPMWDTMLHTTNGFLMAAIGFSLVDLFNRSDRFLVKLSPLFVAVVAFCFSMTIGVLWEFFEFSMDCFFHTDMQKDFFIPSISSTALDLYQTNSPVRLTVESLVVNGEDWMARYGGYLDIGLIDTMKDLLVNFIGAVTFSVIGYFYVKQRGNGRGKMANRLIPFVHHQNDNTDAFGNPIDPNSDVARELSNPNRRRYTWDDE